MRTHSDGEILMTQAAAARRFGLAIWQIKYAMEKYQVKPVVFRKKSGADMRCKWYRKKDLIAALCLVFVKMPIKLRSLCHML
jgi:hypothetical protein